MPSKIEEEICAIVLDETLVYTDYFINDGYSQHLFSTIVKTPITKNFSILGENYIGCTSTPLIRKKDFISIGKFDEKLPSNQEWDLWIRLVLSNYKIVYVAKPLIIKYQSKESITNDRNIRIEGWKILFNKYKKTYLKHRDQYSKALYFYSLDVRLNKQIFRSTMILLYSIHNKFIWRIHHNKYVK